MKNSQDSDISPELQAKFNDINITINWEKFTQFATKEINNFIENGAYIEYSSMIISYAWILGLTYDEKWFCFIDGTGEEIELRADELKRLEYTKHVIQRKLCIVMGCLNPWMQYTIMPFCWVDTNKNDTLHDRILYINFEGNEVVHLENKTRTNVNWFMDPTR